MSNTPGVGPAYNAKLASSQDIKMLANKTFKLARSGIDQPGKTCKETSQGVDWPIGGDKKMRPVWEPSKS